MNKSSIASALTRPRRPGGSRPQRAVPAAYVGEPLVGIDTDAGRVWIPESDGVIRPYMEQNGTWEAEEGHLLRTFFRPGLRFLDVGANVGYFSLLVGRECPDASIHAFEPHPLTSRVLALNAWNADAEIVTHALALSGGDRTLAIDTAPNNLGDSRTRASGRATMLCPAAPLDEVLPGAVFDLVKVDVQGFELPVISGMAGMIARSPGVVIVAEFWPTALREQGVEPVGVLEAYQAMGLTVRAQVGTEVTSLAPVDIVRVCDGAGPDGQINLILTT